MASLAADDAAQADHRGVLTALGELSGRQGDLEGARHPDQVKAVGRDAMAHERIAAAGPQRLGDESVEPGRDDREPPLGRRKIAFQNRHRSTGPDGGLPGGDRTVLALKSPRRSDPCPLPTACRPLPPDHDKLMLMRNSALVLAFFIRPVNSS